MASEAVGRPRRKGGGAVLFRALLWRFPWLRPLLWLTPTMAWFVLVYLASLALLLITAFWSIDPFTTQIVQVWNTRNFETILGDPTYRIIIGRTAGLAGLVTVTDVVLAFPLAYYMAKVASRRVQSLIFAAVLLPLWASYLARVYAWILILNHTCVLNWSLQSIRLPPANIGYTDTAQWLALSDIMPPVISLPAYD